MKKVTVEIEAGVRTWRFYHIENEYVIETVEDQADCRIEEDRECMFCDGELYYFDQHLGSDLMEIHGADFGNSEDEYTKNGEPFIQRSTCDGKKERAWVVKATGCDDKYKDEAYRFHTITWIDSIDVYPDEGFTQEEKEKFEKTLYHDDGTQKYGAYFRSNNVIREILQYDDCEPYYMFIEDCMTVPGYNAFIKFEIELADDEEFDPAKLNLLESYGECQLFLPGAIIADCIVYDGKWIGNTVFEDETGLGSFKYKSEFLRGVNEFQMPIHNYLYPDVHRLELPADMQVNYENGGKLYADEKVIKSFEL